MKQKTRCLALIAGLVLPLACLGQQDDAIPMGKLGHKLGTYLTIEGPRPTTDIKPGNMRVDTVNGKKLDKPIEILVENMARIPDGVRCTIRGYESGKMIGLPFEVAEKEKIPLPQAGWQFFRYFVATSVVAPPELKLKNK